MRSASSFSSTSGTPSPTSPSRPVAITWPDTRPCEIDPKGRFSSSNRPSETPIRCVTVCPRSPTKTTNTLCSPSAVPRVSTVPSSSATCPLIIENTCCGIIGGADSAGSYPGSACAGDIVSASTLPMAVLPNIAINPISAAMRPTASAQRR